MQNTSSALQHSLIYIWLTSRPPLHFCYLYAYRSTASYKLPHYLNCGKMQANETESSHSKQQNRCVFLARTTNQTNRLPAALMNDCLAICMHNTHAHTHIHTHIHLYVEYLCTCSTVALSLFILPLFDCDTHANATYPSSRVCASLHCC